jgi:hypothetical protein
MSTIAEVDQELEQSKFFIDINNSLGLDFEKVKGELLELSLTNYPEYSKLRSAIIEGITREQTKEAYLIYWRIFKKGIIKTKEGNVLQMAYVRKGATTGTKFQPQLPDQIINKFSQKSAQTILDIARQCVDEIMPENHLNLAQQRQRDLLVANRMTKD